MALKNKNLLVVSIGIGIQAAILVLINAFIPKLCNGMDMMWVSFQAWAMYFMAGCTAKDGAKVFIGYFTGIVASIAIIKLMGAPGIKSLPVVAGMSLAMAMAVLIVVIPAIMTENLKNFVPALFVGSGAFFAIYGMGTFSVGASENTKMLHAGQAELVYCLVGQIFGWVTVTARCKYEASLAR